MEPIFTIPYSEYRAIEIIGKYFKKNDGYSIFIPVSRQQKGIDFALLKSSQNGTKSRTFQVKGSRTYFPKEATRKTKREKHKYTLWFNAFEVPKEADLIVLIGLYPDHAVGAKVNRVPWKPICLVFTNKELKDFMKNLKTKSGEKESKFVFGFNTHKDIYLRRGVQDRELIEYTEYLIENRIDLLKRLFS